MATARRKQIEIGWAMVDFMKRHQKFSKDQLRIEMSMNTDNLNDWLALYQAFNIGPKIRTIKVNGNSIYEVVRKAEQIRVEVSEEELKPVVGQRKTKLQVGLNFIRFLDWVEQAFYQTTLERVLGMALPHSIEWIQLYQMFNEGPKLIEQEKGRNINYIVKTKEK